MKNFIIVLLMCLFVGGCSIDRNNLDGRYVKDAQGNIYHVSARVGDTYFLKKVTDYSPNDDLKVLRETK